MGCGWSVQVADWFLDNQSKVAWDMERNVFTGRFIDMASVVIFSVRQTGEYPVEDVLGRWV